MGKPVGCLFMIRFFKNSTLILVVVLAICPGASAQDEMLFLNGKIIKGELIRKTNFEFTFKTGKYERSITLYNSCTDSYVNFLSLSSSTFPSIKNLDKLIETRLHKSTS